MQSRMNKYYNSDELADKETSVSRSEKNKKLYKEVGNLEIENYDSNNNYSVIGTADKQIDVDEVKDMLEKKYKEIPKKKSIGDATEINLPEIKLDETREYDINAVLKKVKEQKEVDYEEDRKKKLRNTQYDILKNLNLDGTSQDDEEDEEEVVEEDTKEEKGQDLIDEATEEEGTTDLALDILSDLRGDEDDTKEVGAIEIEERSEEDDEDEEEDEEASSDKILETKDIPKELFEETDEFTKTDIIEEDDDPTQELFEEAEKKKNDNKLLENTVTGENTFTTTSSMFTTDEFADFADLKSKISIGNILIKILIVIIVLTVIAGIVYLVNKYMNLGLF